MYLADGEVEVLFVVLLKAATARVLVEGAEEGAVVLSVGDEDEWVVVEVKGDGDRDKDADGRRTAGGAGAGAGAGAGCRR